MTTYTVGVAGNPNSGKTTLFNALTGSRQTVGNWPGVTVERKVGEYHAEGRHVRMIDLPGIYSLSARSLDEKLARDFVLSDEAELIINIVDASNLERNLYLTVQLLEMRVPLVVALNMMDVVRADQTEINVAKLAARLGCPVVPIVARTGEGVEALRRKVAEAAERPSASSIRVEYPREVEQGIAELQAVVAGRAAEDGVDSRWLAVKLLEDDPAALVAADDDAVRKPLARAKRRIEADLVSVQV